MVSWITKPKSRADYLAYYGAHTAANMATRPNFRKAAVIAATAGKAAYDYFSSSEKNMAIVPRKRKVSAPTTPMSRNVRRKLDDLFRAGARTPQAMRARGQHKTKPNINIRSSRSAGFLKSRRRVPKGYSKGVKFVSERGGVLDTKILGDAGPTVVIGHASLACERVLTMVFEEMCRHLAIKVGMRVTDIDVDLLGATNDVIRLRYYADRSNLTAKSQFDYVQPAVVSSIGLVAGNLKDFWLTLTEQAQIDEISFIPLSNQTPAPAASNYTRVIIPLAKASVSYYAKSSLKIQNRTTETVGDDDANDVDNVPLYGKSYSGPGNGMRSITGVTGQSFVADDAFGDIWKQDTRVQNGGLQEPPPAGQFSKVTRFGKAKIEPGHIKTSVLTHRSRLSLDKILQMLQQEATGAGATQVYKNFGKFRVFILEKMIQTLGSTDDLGIKIGYEVNLATNLSMSISYENASILKTRVGNINTTVQ